MRELLQAVGVPAWVKRVVVVADTAYPSRANRQAIQAQGWYFVLAFPRTWKWTNGQYLRRVVRSRGWRNDSPKHTKLLVTNLPQATAHLTVALYLRRWPVELCRKELQSVVGLGQHPVTKDAARGDRSVAVACMAYVRVLRLRAQHSQSGSSWSAFTLKPQFAWEVGPRQRKPGARHEARQEVQRRATTKEPHLRLAA